MHLIEDIAIILTKVKHTPSEELESDEIEFKEYSSETALHNAKELAEEISALSNYKGGLVIIGVRDSNNVKNEDWQSQLVGFDNVDLHTTKERLVGKLRPKLNLSLHETNFESKNYLIIEIPKRIDTLVSTTSGKVCIREGKSSRPMEPDEIKYAVKALQDYDWSSEIVRLPSDDALDELAVSEAYDEFATKRKATQSSKADFLEAIGVTVNGHLTKSGLIFLGKAEVIKKRLGNFEYRFSRKTKSGKLPTNDIWNDCLWTTIKKAKEHFAKSNDQIEIPYEKKKYTLPKLDEIAFHEALLNALVHRDYSIDGMVSIEFLDKCITITSPGTFYGGVNSDNIFSHEPRHRNKALARMLMEYHLVDRAGMGVFRMSLNSLKYGRDFPKFIERNNSVVVSMQAEYFRPGIFVLSQMAGDNYGIPEYLILNSLYEKGYVPVQKILDTLSRIETSPWEVLKGAVSQIDQVELCGDKSNIYVRVKPAWNKIFNVQKSFRASTASDNYVKLYDFIIKHKDASNADIKDHLGHKHTPQTSKFLREIKYVQRSGRGPTSRWSFKKVS